MLAVSRMRGSGNKGGIVFQGRQRDSGEWGFMGSIRLLPEEAANSLQRVSQVFPSGMFSI